MYRFVYFILISSSYFASFYSPSSIVKCIFYLKKFRFCITICCAYEKKDCYSCCYCAFINTTIENLSDISSHWRCVCVCLKNNENEKCIMHLPAPYSIYLIRIFRTKHISKHLESQQMFLDSFITDQILLSIKIRCGNILD